MPISVSNSNYGLFLFSFFLIGGIFFYACWLDFNLYLLWISNQNRMGVLLKESRIYIIQYTIFSLLFLVFELTLYSQVNTIYISIIFVYVIFSTLVRKVTSIPLRISILELFIFTIELLTIIIPIINFIKLYQKKGEPIKILDGRN